MTDRGRSELCHLVSGSSPAPRLWAAVDNGRMAQLVPEFLDLRMKQNPQYRHKEILEHTIIVVGQAPDDLMVRLGAFFHDIGKPATRRYVNGDVTFRHHEEVGAKMTRSRLAVLGFTAQEINDVSDLVRLSGRFKGYAGGWSDSAVRRYARDAGHLLPKLNMLVRADCTTRHQHKREHLQLQVDDLERRLRELDEAERIASERPQIDGGAVMAHLGLSPGPIVGQALRWLLDLKRAEGELSDDELFIRLEAWWEAHGAGAAPMEQRVRG